MKTKQPSLFPFILLLASAIACNMERVVNPSLPTYTASPPPAGMSQGLIPTPTLTPTPEPGARVKSGDQALFYGDWDRAINEYTIAIETNQDPEIHAAAYLGLGQTYYQSGRFQKALDSITIAIAQFPDSPHRSSLFFTLAQINKALDQPADAIAAYQEYLRLRPGLLEYYVYSEIGDLKMVMGDYQSAIDNYTLAIQSPHIGDTLDINIKIGDANVLLGDPASAIVIYQDVFNRTTNDYIKAQMQRYIGHTSIEMGLLDQGNQAYLFAVENYPLSYDAYLALVELIDAGIQVNELDRGLVDYYAGQYAVASSAFERYLSQKPETDVDTALFYNGLSLVQVTSYEAAIREFQKIVDDHQNSKYLADAYDEISYTQWFYLGQYKEALDTLDTFLKRAPDHPQAPELLYFAGRIAEQDNRLLKAAALWERLGVEYASSEYGYDGFFQAGIARYRIKEYATAISDFQSAQGLALNQEDQARAHFWVGKAYSALGDQQSAYSGFQQALEADPTGYYSERARDHLEARQPFAPPTNYSILYNAITERTEAETWLRLVFTIPEDVDLADMTALSVDPRFTRGTELWHLGLYNQARAEFESLRSDITTDALNSFRLGTYLIDLGLYRSGITAIRQVLNLAGYDDAGTFRAPVFFNRLRFGAYFQEIVLPVAESYGFHPLFLFSVLRQESLFEGFVTSTAGARGLMQIIPSTGETIYNRTGWPPDYSSQDLYRPLVSITYGTDYLAGQRNAYDDLFVALAAYNGGPGNAVDWKNLAQGDTDLFVEVVRFSETRRYLRSIYELHCIYRNLYELE